MNLVPFKAIYPNLSLVASPDSFFATVKSQYTEYSGSGFFKQDEENAIYVYQLVSNNRIHNAIICCTDIEDFSNGSVLKHENTIAAKEQKMMNLMLQNRAMVKPVLLAYDRVSEIDKIIADVIENESEFLNVAFTETNEYHSLWKIDEVERLKKVQKLFKNRVRRSYIADGHHRVKTSQLLKETNISNEVLNTKLKSILTVYFSWDQLSIYDFNRCIDAFQNLSPIRFMADLSKYCRMKPIRQGKKPKEKHEMTMLLYGEWYQLRWKKSILEKHKKEIVLFDTFLLNKYILNNLLNIQDVREDMRVKYIDGVEGIEGLEDLVGENQNRVGFCMYPIDSKDVKIISEKNEVLPPKSTWFEPRVKNGLLVKAF